MENSKFELLEDFAAIVDLELAIISRHTFKQQLRNNEIYHHLVTGFGWMCR